VLCGEVSPTDRMDSLASYSCGVVQTFMRIRNVFYLCAALAFVTACKSSDPAEQMVSLMEDIGAAVESSGGDCAKMASGIESAVGKYDLEKIKADAEKMKDGGDKAQAEEMMKKYGDRLEKVMPKMMGMAKCSDDPKMKELQSKLKGMM
jgi:hypothetical protein